MLYWFTVVFCVLMPTAPALAEEAAPDAFAIKDRLGRGINLGNTFEPPTVGAWGVTLEPDHLPRIAEAGFQSVRIPVRWATHVENQPPYKIDPAFLALIQEAVDTALANKLAVVLNNHHDTELDKAPHDHIDRLEAVWRQVATHFEAYPPELVFELNNEPHEQLDAPIWNAFIPRLLAAVRESNPTRTVMIGGAQWNSIESLKDLVLPEDDHLIVTFHFYSPFQFTHQGAGWVAGDANAWLGTTWTGSEEQCRAIDEALDTAAAWAKEHHVPLYMGEFGAYSKADMNSRVMWTRYLREQAEHRGIAWAYWEFGSGFGAYDRKTRQWREGLLEALIPGD